MGVSDRIGRGMVTGCERVMCGPGLGTQGPRSKASRRLPEGATEAGGPGPTWVATPLLQNEESASPLTYDARLSDGSGGGLLPRCSVTSCAAVLVDNRGGKTEEKNHSLPTLLATSSAVRWRSRVLIMGPRETHKL